jgi:hypothetical protein
MKHTHWIMTGIVLGILALCFIAAWGGNIYGYNEGLCEGFEEGHMQGVNDYSKTAVGVLQDTFDEAYLLGWSEGYARAVSDTEVGCCDICVKYPTREQVLAFLEADSTDALSFDFYDFNCTDYCEQVNEKAWAQGIPCYLVWITFEGLDLGHTILAFPICEGEEETMLYVEPQADAIIDGELLVKGGIYPLPFCDETGEYCKLYIIEKVRIYK